MKIRSKHKFNCCNPEQVWEKLTDIDYLGGIIADGKGLKKVGKNTYKGKLPLQMPGNKGKLATTFKLKDLDKPKSFRLYVWGKNGALRVSSKGEFNLRKRSGTAASYMGNLKLFYKLPAGIKAGALGPMNKEAKKSLEKALASLFRKIDRQCCKEINHAH